MAEKRFSQQRERIYQAVYGSKEHPTAQMVYDQLRPELPKLSLGTVYRNLNNLATEGSIIRFTVGGKERFDGNTTPHIHFVCDKCGEIQDVFHNSVHNFLDQMTHILGCTVNGAHMVINGDCESCRV